MDNQNDKTRFCLRFLTLHHGDPSLVPWWHVKLHSVMRYDLCAMQLTITNAKCSSFIGNKSVCCSTGPKFGSQIYGIPWPISYSGNIDPPPTLQAPIKSFWKTMNTHRQLEMIYMLGWPCEVFNLSLIQAYYLFAYDL